MSGLIAAVDNHPKAVFAGFLLLHLAVWTLLPAVLYPNLPLDLIEALTYGREWQLGYDKLPPLPWWLVEVTYRVFGFDAAYYALAQAAVVAAFALVFATALPLVGTRRALVAVLIVDGLHYFQYTAAKFNHDVIQLPFWALAGYAFHAALKRGQILHWCLFGVAIGLALWAKYFVVVLAVPLALFLLVDDDARKALWTPGPWLAALIALAIMAPHLVWLVQNDFLPFAYASARAAPSRGWIDHVIHPLSFALGQLGFLVPALLIAAALVWPRARTAEPVAADPFDRRIVAWLAFGPVITLLVMAVISGRGVIAMWGYPLWLFLGLWIVLSVPGPVEAGRMKRIVATWAVVFAVFAVAFVVNYGILPSYDHRYRAVLYPGDILADELARRFRSATGQPLRYVIGTMWDGGNVAHYAAEQPRVLIDGLPRRAPWIDLGDLRSKGGVVLWTDGEPNVIPVAYRSLAADAQVQPPFRLQFRRGGRELTVGWAILRPQPAFAAR